MIVVRARSRTFLTLAMETRDTHEIAQRSIDSGVVQRALAHLWCRTNREV